MVTMMGNAKNKFCLQISEKLQEKETGYSCIANNTFGKHSEEQQIIKNVIHLLAVPRQGKQLWNCGLCRPVWNGTCTLLSAPTPSPVFVLSCHVWTHPSPTVPLHTFSNVLIGKLFFFFHNSKVSVLLSTADVSCIKWAFVSFWDLAGMPSKLSCLSLQLLLCSYKVYCFFSVSLQWFLFHMPHFPLESNGLWVLTLFIFSFRWFFLSTSRTLRIQKELFPLLASYLLDISLLLKF